MLGNRFIVFEGLDGAGKSTLLQGLRRELEHQQANVLVTREPGGTPLSEELRQIILRRGPSEPSPKTELLLYEAARAQHVDTHVRPALEKGYWVLCDRFTASSIAFQAGGRLIDEDKVEWLNSFATEGLQPILTVLLDIPFDVAQARQKKRWHEQKQNLDRMESEAQDFHERVRASFLAQAQRGGTCWIVLSALMSPDELLQSLLNGMKERYLWPFSKPL